MDSLEIVLRNEVERLRRQLQEARRLLIELRKLSAPVMFLDEIDDFIRVTKES